LCLTVWGHYNPPDKQFNLIFEYDEFIYHEALQLWSEYFAQRMASSFHNSSEDYLLNLIDYVRKPFVTDNLTEQLYHSYRIAYFFILYIAYFHQANLMVPLFDDYAEEENLVSYFDSFKALADVLSDLYDRKENWDFKDDSESLANTYNQLILTDSCVKEFYTL
jgi:hypothetical protein